MAEGKKRIYEAMFLVDSSWASGSWDEVEAAINNFMDRAQANILNLKKWDDRRLCYEIKGHNRGTYILCYFEALPSAITGIERDIRLSDSFLRVLILSAEKIPSEIRDAATPAMIEAEGEQDRDQGESGSEPAAAPVSEAAVTATATATAVQAAEPEAAPTPEAAPATESPAESENSDAETSDEEKPQD